MKKTSKKEQQINTALKRMATAEAERDDKSLKPDQRLAACANGNAWLRVWRRVRREK